jgi:hypothetical protein
MINVLSFGKKKNFGQKSCEFFFFSPSVNLTNSTNFWGKSPTFKYQKIKGKKKKKKKKQTNKHAHLHIPNYDYVLFEWAHYVCNSHTPPTKATLEGHCGTT